jgi:Na+/melibiose symporter-like transporter
MTPLLAATTLDKLKNVSPQTWWLIGGGIVAFILFVVIIRKLMDGANKFILAAVIALVVFIVGLQWVYERNEPAWATPAVDLLARFLPSKGKPAAPATTPGKTPAPKPK